MRYEHKPAIRLDHTYGLPAVTGENLYLPMQARITEIVVENPLVKSFSLSFIDKVFQDNFDFSPGQFMMLSVPGCGEAPISISSSATPKKHIVLTIRRVGKLTETIHTFKKGDVIGLRGPYGNGFPFKRMVKKDLFFIAGGIGMAPLHSLIAHCFSNRDQYGKMNILYGSRNMSEICFLQDLEEWQKDTGTSCLLTVDEADDSWSGKVGLVTEFLGQFSRDPAKELAFICGPSIMIRFVIEGLRKQGCADKNLYTTLERQMKCGVGLCGHCHFDHRLICADGPVYSADELGDLTRL